MIETKKSQRTIFVLNGEVDSNDLMNNIPEDFDGDIIINGCLKLFGDVKANASIWVVGNIFNFCEISSIEIVGDLICTGDNWCKGNIIVHGVCYCGGDLLNSCNIKAEDLECDGIISTGGEFIYSGDIEVGGNLTCNSNIECADIKVGDDLTCNGNIYSSNIEVRGNLTCNSYIKSGDIEVGSDLFCDDYIESGDITVGGDFFCDGDIDSYKIVVEGDFLHEGHVDTNGESIIVGGEEIFDY